MLFESPHIQVAASDGIATLGMTFPGLPANAFDLARLRELERAIDAVQADAGIEILVVRSLLPGGFCGGFSNHVGGGFADDSQASAFASVGQGVFTKLAEAAFTSVAFIEGPCVGPGLDLALACDFRLGRSCPDSRIGFGELPTCWGGLSRAKKLIGMRRLQRFLSDEPVSAREAVRFGLFDHAFSTRRSKIELRTWLDRLQARPGKKPIQPPTTAFVKERHNFIAKMRSQIPSELFNQPLPATINPIPPLPEYIALVGCNPSLAVLAVEFAIRNQNVFVADPLRGSVEHALAGCVDRGRITPLERDQARQRIGFGQSLLPVVSRQNFYGLVIGDDFDLLSGLEAELPPRTIVAVHADAKSDLLMRLTQCAARPGRVLGITSSINPEVIFTKETQPDTLAAIVTWLRKLNEHVTFRSAIGDNQAFHLINKEMREQLV